MNNLKKFKDRVLLMKFQIVIPCHNCEKWIKESIVSLKAQDYPHFQCIIIDDCSTDKTSELAERFVDHDPRFTIQSNKRRLLALKNIRDGFELLNPAPSDILFVLDGDDWLATNTVLSYLKDLYKAENCWTSYGNMIQLSKLNIRVNHAYTEDVIKNALYRQDTWKFIQLRTFLGALWNEINQEDFLDADGQHFPVCSDWAIMMPILEMAGGRFIAVDRILYIYNDLHANGDSKLYRPLQKRVEKFISQKDKYGKKEFLNLSDLLAISNQENNV